MSATLSPPLKARIDRFRPGYDVPLPNGCWLCIGCGVILPKNSGWNQCSDCDTRTHEDY